MITMTVDSHVKLPYRELGRVAETIRTRLTFPNPSFAEAERAGRWTGNIPEEVTGVWGKDGVLYMPRGAARQVVGILKAAGVQFRVEDRRRLLPPVNIEFRGKLKDFQEKAINDLKARDFGTLAAPTGSGKTVMALALIAQRGQPALVVIHNRELLRQWQDRIETFLEIPKEEIGIIGCGEQKIGDRITLAIVNTLIKCLPAVVPYVGNLVVDECHRCPCRTFQKAVIAFDCRYMTGLTATPFRRDGLGRLIWWYLGDLVHEVDKGALVKQGHVLSADVVWRETSFRPYHDPSEEYSKMLSELTQDPARNALISSDVAREAGNGGGVILILTDRKAHCDTLAAFLEDYGIDAAILTGDLSNGERQTVVGALNDGHIKVLIATGQLIGEGFDCKELSTLFLATPIKFNGRLLQYLGRVLRPAPGKDRAKVYDYLDPVGVLQAAARARRRVYRSDKGE
jgi:superfamily II DNA or RNA helicase